MNEFPTLIHVQSGQYPISKYDLAERHPDVSFGTVPDVGYLAELGYAIVEDMPGPAGDKVTLSPTPAHDEVTGKYSQAWVVSAYTAEEKSVMLQARVSAVSRQINTALTKTLEKGAVIDFGGTAGIQHMQMRDGDRANILGLRASAQAMLDAQEPFIFRVRTYENTTVELTSAQVIALSWHVFAAYTQALEIAWNMKDTYSAIETLEDFPADAPILPFELTPKVL